MFRFWNKETDFNGQNIQSPVVELVGDQARCKIQKYLLDQLEN